MEAIDGINIQDLEDKTIDLLSVISRYNLFSVQTCHILRLETETKANGLPCLLS